MAILADCPSCSFGDHENHVEHWGKRPEEVIDGEFCHCPGDCKERADRYMSKWLSTEED